MKAFRSIAVFVIIGLTLFFAGVKTGHIPKEKYNQMLMSISSYDCSGVSQYFEEKVRDKEEKIEIYRYSTAEKYRNLHLLVSGEKSASFSISDVWKCFRMGRRLMHEMYFLASQPEQPEYLETFEKNTEYLLRELDGASLTDVEKALIVHDRLVCWCTYDYDRYLENNIPDDDYTSYGVIINRKGVCAGYAGAYKYLMHRLGIDCKYISSNINNHAWNIITVNGKKYHVDVTWDDPVPDRFGKAQHDNFLRSTKGIRETGHLGSDYDTTPHDKTYDEYSWQKSDEPVKYFNGSFWYVNHDTCRLIRKTGNEETECAVLSRKWCIKGTGNYCIDSNCTQLADNGKWLFFTDYDLVYSVDGNGQIKPVFRPDIPDGYCVYGIDADEETVTVMLRNFCAGEGNDEFKFESFHPEER